MTISLTIDTITFGESELDYEANGGLPVVITSLSSIQNLDSYIMDGTKEYKLYSPSPKNIPISYQANLIINRSRVSSINSLIFKQVNILKQFRKTGNSGLLEGFIFKYNNDINSRVWINSFNIDSSYYDATANIEKLRCKIGLQEAE